MWKGLLGIILLISLIGCGKPEPVIAGIDFPPDPSAGDNSLPSNVSNDNPVTPAPEAPAAVTGVKVLNAPMVLLKGQTPQYRTLMNVAPGA